MNDKVNTESEIRDLIFMSASEIGEINRWIDEWNEETMRLQEVAYQEMEAAWERFMEWVDSL